MKTILKGFLLISSYFLITNHAVAQNNNVVSNQCFNQIANGLNGNPNHDTKLVGAGQSGCNKSPQQSDSDGFGGQVIILNPNQYYLNNMISNSFNSVAQNQNSSISNSSNKTPINQNSDFGFGSPNVVNNLNN